ncbi:MAG: Serine/threonine-protein phosphatase 1 [Deltaproteobacteria bacterium ADurb.Bin510]|nr:MAG: Serine/threonine-protein phosphatase 1 [Deltaproteobacteria bacterium ADurb.Bin510]
MIELSKTTYAIGDIHGYHNKLEALIERIQPTRYDTLVFLGDYIDRGPDSRKVVDYLIELSAKTSCVFLCGNHEELLLDYLATGRHEDLWLENGGQAMVDNYISGRLSPQKLKDAMPASHLKFFDNLRYYYEDEAYIYVHAGLLPGLPLEQQKPEVLCWIRNDFFQHATKRSKKVIFGHTHFALPLVSQDKIGIDTGAAYGGPLTAVKLPHEMFIMADG